MIIAVENGLTSLKGQLREKGFEVVNYGEYQHPIDALIYHSNIDIAQIKAPANFSNANHISSGVFLVNANGKTVDEIVRILTRRAYSPIF